MDKPNSPSVKPTLDSPNSTQAAEYVRMSTEHQQYSTENQSDVIREYAQKRGMVIVRTYEDAGKSGLRIDGRDALKQLIHDVETGQAEYKAILVYDVSRWGRFQDADESAYYEYICRRAKIDVHYCAEQFEKRWQPGFDNRQRREARDGRRVQPGAFRQGLHWPVSADRTRVPAGRRARVRATPDAARPSRRSKRGCFHAASRRASRPTV